MVTWGMEKTHLVRSFTMSLLSLPRVIHANKSNAFYWTVFKIATSNRLHSLAIPSSLPWLHRREMTIDNKSTVISYIRIVVHIFKKSSLGLYSERNVSPERTNPDLCDNSFFHILNILYTVSLFAFSNG